ncbi:MAG: lipoprotein-34 precursor (NlpB) [Gammaproteobacteria bacterium]|uniref:lipoprotein-34 precursor (NlpB) n=1 Tax=Acinetobacter TaxID=469 RepID=UPI001444DF7B|nr:MULTISPECIES: lipoprotein-34 precursor (NlpB) [Acinetobacter]NLN56780.1 lipoprotein-34 precursor (NlpB) [Gammaproteobacteria bacterium]MBF4522042.1 lipoprotein-34 precursor (NlpB) [Acinetobacter towneri]MBT0887709.1 lipoprotein-34 precursor (NlpB) [Acinetobacter towneri]MDM1486077.1 lipoprotein-34 precursor (NlpB) [Acinetobacter towneri]NWJ93115.1 lipoprotein-34 precursor (NlpB) [Acinetobacter sp. Swhac1]
MQLRFGFIAALSVLSLAGCSSLAINNGSLDYKDTTTLAPLQYPEGSVVRPATPLYPAPSVDPLATANAPKLENSRGNRFAMPRPEAVQANTTVEDSTQIGRPQPVVDGNQNPLLKIDGNSATIWQYTLATLSSLNYSIVGQSKNRYEATIKVDQQIYVLRLTSVGSSNNLAVFNADNSFADQEKAADLLAQIYQNWPA